MLGDVICGNAKFFSGLAAFGIVLEWGEGGVGWATDGE